MTIDKLYITQSEWSNWFGGARVKKEDVTFKKLPFNCCALSLKPFSDPVCTPEGIIFDLIHIVPYVKKHGVNPVTGAPLDIKDLVRLNISKNADGEYYCPVTLRTFHENLHIVANRKTGNVYAKEAIDKLNDWTDFATGEPFAKEDLIDLQNPDNLERANMVQFHHLKEILKDEEETGRSMADRSIPSVNLNGSAGRVIAEMNGKDQATLKSKGKVAASLTSTFVTPVTKNEYNVDDAETTMFKAIKTTGRAIMRTNMGDLTFELFCDKAPKTCYNFISLAKKGYYQGIKFHRLVPGFVIQGGDPTGDGTGGESVWGKPFGNEVHPSLSHSERGILSMANRGTPCSNTSQFFITLAPKKHLDKIHPVFGKMIAGFDVLDLIEAVPQADTRPLRDIVVKDVVVMVDPFEEYQKSTGESVAARKRHAAAIDPTLALKRAKASANTPLTIGKYMKK